jgi:Na+-transporting methylmalonyl-CoA/oxaloacetate decarboxylase beta subunit
MAGKKLQEMSNEKLLEQKKAIGFLVGLLTGALLTLLAITIYISINQGFTPLLIIPFALLPILLLNVNTLRGIKKELHSRNGEI